MPRVTQDYLEGQRADILEGARRCFAAHGYGEATVVRLEEATGRSRGAIFHHFPTKLDLFLAVLEQDAEREAARWEAGSVADALTGLAAEDPDWASVVIEQSRRHRTDPIFRDRWTHRTALVRNALHTLVDHERAAARIAPTIPDEVAARFISVVGDGLLLQRAILGEVPHAPEVVALATAALAGNGPDDEIRRGQLARRSPNPLLVGPPNGRVADPGNEGAGLSTARRGAGGRGRLQARAGERVGGGVQRPGPRKGRELSTVPVGGGERPGPGVRSVATPWASGAPGPVVGEGASELLRRPVAVTPLG